MSQPDIFQITLAKEVQGDASNLKGTDYHLVYAIWLLIVERVKQVSFFVGNDLLASEERPASPMSMASRDVCARATEGSDSVDTWIQLKCTQEPWTIDSLLSDNLVRNFVLNTFLSESNAQRWNRG